MHILRYGEEDLAGAKSLVDQCPSDDPDTEMNLACLLAKEGRLQVGVYRYLCMHCQVADPDPEPDPDPYRCASFKNPHLEEKLCLPDSKFVLLFENR